MASLANVRFLRCTYILNGRGILGDFEDVDDKANAVLDDEIERSVTGNQDIYEADGHKLFDGMSQQRYL